MEKNQLNIQLTAQEELLFSTLLNYKKELELKTVMRVAGGWVRDKVIPTTIRLWAKNHTTLISLSMI
jgi:hypothetical protein